MTLSPEVGRAFYGHFLALQPAQRAAIEPLLAGEDALIRSGTGSGKTEAVVAPLLQRYRSLANAASGPILLYVTPTRALANDLLRRLEGPCDQLGLVAGIRHGERNDLGRRRKPDLLITTPESLDVLLTARAVALRPLQAVILDEIHLSYNTQRGFQLAVLLQRLERFLGRPVQVAGLSATVAEPDDNWTFFRPDHRYALVEDRQQKLLDWRLASVANTADLSRLLDRAAGEIGAKVLLFVNARQECDRLATDLRGRTRFGERVYAHHASLDRAVRLNVERAFQEAGSALCIATSTLELGIDIGDVDLIVLYGHPGGWESFLQRAGRGSRRAAKTNLLCLLAPEHGSLAGGALAFAALLAQIECGRLEREPPRLVYGAVLQQLLSLLLERAGAYRPFSELAAPFAAWPHLQPPVIEYILDHMAAQDLTRRHPVQRRYGAGEQLHRLRALALNWGNFPLQSRDVKLSAYGHDLGAVPAGNLLSLTVGDVVPFAGRRWRVRRLAADAIHVDPTDDPTTAEMVYPHARLPLDPATVEEMLFLLTDADAALPQNTGSPELHGHAMDQSAAPSALDALLPAMTSAVRAELLTLVARLRPYIGWDRLAWMADEGGNYHYATFAGAAMNHVLAAWTGVARYTAGEALLRSEDPINFSQLPTDLQALQRLAGAVLRQPERLTYFQMALSPDLLAEELADQWLKTPVHSRTLHRLRHARLVVAPPEALAALEGIG